MLSYDDCVGLSELTQEEIAAVAQHEHLPEIVALEMGASLCRSPEGKNLIRRMIVEESEEAFRRGDTRTAARLGLVLHHFINAHMDRHGAMEPCHQASATELPTMREHADAYLAAMLRHFDIERASAQERFGPEMQVAEMCCAACTETERCRHFLTGEAEGETPSSFCPNAPLLEELGRGAHFRAPSETAVPGV